MSSPLPNIHFDDIPIEFKQINPEDFDSNYYNVDEKHIIEPNEEGYIGEPLKEVLLTNLNEKNTTVINAGVGQGKSRSIIEVIGEYAKSPDYLIVIAVPYKNLIEQYVKDCERVISSDRIFNLLQIEEMDILNDELKNTPLYSSTNTDDLIVNRFQISNYKIHVLTINALLGNSGEDNLFQSRKRIAYFEKLSTYCENHNKKMIWVFDEIHDGIYNFKEEFIYSLWNYQGLVHKTFIISATFNEASKEVIKYISEFTDRRIKIIESRRTRVCERQSRLHINFYSGYYVERDANLVKLIKRLIKNDFPFDVMVYSKNLTKNLIKRGNGNNEEVGDYLSILSERINKTYSDIFDRNAGQKYNEDLINVGTNFTTGVNIEKENHNYIVIFPKEVNIEYFNNRGVFTNGANTIIQTLARQRKKGDIYIFLPYPFEIEPETLPYTPEKNQLIIDFFHEYRNPEPQFVSYSNINNQNKELDKVYNNLKKRIRKATANIQRTDRTGMNRLLFHPKEIFKLYLGEKYLTEFSFFGGNLSTYIVWSSLCNQFLNCRLHSVHSSNIIYLDSNNLNNEVIEIAKSEFEDLSKLSIDYNLYNSLTKYELYKHLERCFFYDFEIYVDRKRPNNLVKDKIRLILLNLVIGNTDNVDKTKLYHQYIKSCIYNSSLVDLNNELLIETQDKDEIESIKLFREWKLFIRLLESKKENVKSKYKLPNKPFKEFKALFRQMNMKGNIKNLRNFDHILNTDIFPFNDTFKKIKTEPQMVNAFYKLLIYSYFNGELKPSTKKGKRIYQYVFDEFNNSDIINLQFKDLPEFIL